jgi:hypothetical protein
VEYYLSDKNLSRDKFFHGEISKAEGGWIDFSLIMNCPKLKVLSTDAEEVATAIASSEEVELNEAKDKIRRKDGKELPSLVLKKREEKKASKDDESPDAPLSERHFKNPKILLWSVDEGKPNWRDMENDLQAKYPDLRILYSRADEEKTGHIAICTLGLNEDTLKKLIKDGLES